MLKCCGILKKYKVLLRIIDSTNYFTLLSQMMAWERFLYEQLSRIRQTTMRHNKSPSAVESRG